MPWHRHSQVCGVFYCLEGRLAIDRAEPRSEAPLPAVVLEPGQSARVERGTAHRPHNAGAGPCRFVLVQGVGEYDYLPSAPPRAKER